MEPELQNLRTIETDVLVVGAGGAGFRAAIGAREKGARALLVSKGPLARSGASPMAGADLTCHGQGMRRAGFFGEPNDGPEKFLNDLLYHGFFLNDQKLTEQYVLDGPDRMLEMVEWGVKPYYSDERAIETTGISIMDALHRQARKAGVDTLENVAVLDLLTRAGEVVGALGLDVLTGQFILFKSKATVIATGGWHKGYTPVTGSRDLTGDGAAMAYRAGARLADMEFVTFCCDVVLWPPVFRGSIMTYIFSLMFGGTLENSAGERIFDRYDPWMIAYAHRTEWNKSFISYVTACETRAGKASPHGGVYYRVGDEPFDTFEKKVMVHYPDWIFKGNDISVVAEKLRSGEGIEVGPAAEYFEGGVAVDEDYHASLPGLFAAGEGASSVFGSNRVAAATMEMLTTGARAGWSAAARAKACPQAEPDPRQLQALVEKALQPLLRSEGISPPEVRRCLQDTAMRQLGPIRSAAELAGFTRFLDDLRANDLPRLGSASRSRRYNKTWIEALEIENLVTVLGLSARAALERTESRGVHFREDYPVTDNDRWLEQIVVESKGDHPQLTRKPVRVTAMTPPSGVLPYLEMVKRMMQGHSDTGGAH